MGRLADVGMALRDPVPFTRICSTLVYHCGQVRSPAPLFPRTVID